VSGQWSISHGHTYLLVNNRSVIILPIQPKSAPGIAVWRAGFKGYEPKGTEKDFFLYASIMKYANATPTNTAKNLDE